MNLKNKEKTRISSKKAVVKKKIAAKKNPVVKKNKLLKAKGPVTKKIIPKKAIAKKTAKQKIENKTPVAAIESKLPATEEKNNTVNNLLDIVPHTEMKDLRRKEVQNYDKHQIRLSSVKKGGPKPSGKKPLW